MIFKISKFPSMLLGNISSNIGIIWVVYGLRVWKEILKKNPKRKQAGKNWPLEKSGLWIFRKAEIHRFDAYWHNQFFDYSSFLILY